MVIARCQNKISSHRVSVCIRRSNGDWGRVLNFHLIRNWSSSQEKDHIKSSQLTKFEVLSLDCKHAGGFKKKNGKIRDFVWI